MCEIIYDIINDIRARDGARDRRAASPGPGGAAAAAITQFRK
jgi:hypothetical protein